MEQEYLKNHLETTKGDIYYLIHSHTLSLPK